MRPLKYVPTYNMACGLTNALLAKQGYAILDNQNLHIKMNNTVQYNYKLYGFTFMALLVFELYRN